MAVVHAVGATLCHADEACALLASVDGDRLPDHLPETIARSLRAQHAEHTSFWRRTRIVTLFWRSGDRLPQAP